MKETVILIGFIQSVFGVLIFISKRPKHLSFTYLSFWLSINALFLGSRLLPFQVVDYFKPGIFPLLLLLGPILYFYVSSLTDEAFKPKLVHLYHLLPLIIVGIHRSTINVVSMNISTIAVKDEFNFYNQIYYFLTIVSMFVYWGLSIRSILQHRKKIPYYFSNYSAKNTLNWLIFVVFIFLILFVFDFLASYIEVVFKVNLPFLGGFVGALTLFSFIMIFFGINQSAIYEFDDKKGVGLAGKKVKKYKKSTLNKSQIEEINKKVFDYLKNKKPFLNPEYSLQMMVDDLGISRQNISQVINSGQKKNFYKLVNEFRVEEVKTLLLDPAYLHFTVLGIGLECGFNSKTSFNRIFKEITEKTPSEYKNSLQKK